MTLRQSPTLFPISSRSGPVAKKSSRRPRPQGLDTSCSSLSYLLFKPFMEGAFDRMKFLRAKVMDLTPKTSDISGSDVLGAHVLCTKALVPSGNSSGRKRKSVQKPRFSAGKKASPPTTSQR